MKTTTETNVTIYQGYPALNVKVASSDGKMFLSTLAEYLGFKTVRRRLKENIE